MDMNYDGWIVKAEVRDHVQNWILAPMSADTAENNLWAMDYYGN